MNCLSLSPFAKRAAYLLFGLLAPCTAILAAQEHPNASAAVLPAAPPDMESRVEALLAQLTLEEKLQMLSGDETGFASRGVTRLNIPALRMTDGPVGVRDGSTPSNAYPVSINLAAAWDTELANRFGIALAEDTRAKGKHVIFGPCVGIGRFPLGGRNFESFGEDAYLSSRNAVSVINGIQSRAVIATVKHFACNDQEWRRHTYNVTLDERALRETHLMPFEAAVKESNVWMLMTAYNLVRGEHASENKHLLDILKNEWGFKGLVVSDWTSVYSADKSANNGLDIEMPFPLWWGDKLRAAVKTGAVSEAVIDDKIRRHLRVRFLASVFDNPTPTPDESVVRSQAHRDLATEMAVKSMVLLKNDGILPLSREKLSSIALIGPNAAVARTGGGGSSGVPPWITVSPVQGFKTALGPKVEITTAEGISLNKFKAVPLPAGFLRTPDGKQEGLLGEYFNNSSWEGKPTFTRVDEAIDFDWQDKGPGSGINSTNFTIRWTGVFMPNETRVYRLSVMSDDGSSLYIDDKLLATNNKLRVPGDLLMESGKTYRIRIDYQQDLGNASMHLGWQDTNPSAKTKEPTIAEAVEAAKKAGLVILCVGNSSNQEMEGADVTGFELFNGQEKLVNAVLDANPNTIVVLYGGVPIRIKDWLPRAKAVIAALYPGQEGGTALAQLLLGDKSFSGKLPFSYIQAPSESPAFKSYQDPSRQVNYSEGVFVGYKYYDQHAINPLFPFGHGLSYTSFAYSELKTHKTGPKSAEATVKITNTGKVAGDEIVQLYVEPKQSQLPRPLRELKAFARVSLLPGESKTITITLNERAFSYYDPEKSAWVAEPGDYVIHAAASSRDLRQATTVKLD